MQDLSFCPKCGAALQPDFIFCTSCGFALTNVKNAAPGNTTPEANPPVSPVREATSQEKITVIPNKPAASPPTTAGAPLFTPQVHALIIAVIFAGVGFWIWSMEKSKHKNSFDTESVVTGQQKDNPVQDNKDIPPVTITTNYLQAKDFAGVWRAYEANNSDENEIRLGNPEDDLFIEVNNGSFVMYPRNEKGKEYSAVFTCSEVVDHTISCRGKSRTDESAFTLKLEMQDSKNEMTITIIPDEATETMILKTRRL